MLRMNRRSLNSGIQQKGNGNRAVQLVQLNLFCNDNMHSMTVPEKACPSRRIHEIAIELLKLALHMEQRKRI